MNCKVCNIELDDNNQNLWAKRINKRICKKCEKIRAEKIRRKKGALPLKRNDGKCRICGDELIVNKNTTEAKLNNYCYTCKKCSSKMKIKPLWDGKCNKCGFMIIKNYKNITKTDLLSHTCKKCETLYRKQRNKFIKEKVVNYYSNGTMKCACCGENNLEFLLIDHINGGGNKHRQEEKIRNFYRWLIKNNFPEGFRVLCYNCNMSIGFYGYCPHQNMIKEINYK